LAYGLASLGCALPIFLAVVGSSLGAEGWLPALRQYLLYALGMGSVVTTLTLLTAFAREGALRRARRAGRFVGPLSALLLVLAGMYLLHYWLTLGGVLASLGVR
jgi:cytochrome c biogenesis protein CcdA